MLKIARFTPSLSWRELTEIFKLILKGEEIRNETVREFERQFSRYIGTEFAINVPSARVGLYLLLKNLGLNKDDEVILPSFTYHIVPAIIVSLGLKPVFADIDWQNYDLDISSVEKCITNKTKVIIPTHLYGLPCEMDAILNLAKERGVKVIEDSVQACGAEYKGRKTGSLGDYAYFSFGLTKNLTTLQGGMVTTNDEQMACRIKEEASSYEFPTLFTIAKIAMIAFLMKVFTNSYIFSFSLYPLMRLLDSFNRDPIHNMFNEKPILFFKDILKSYKWKLTNIEAKVGLGQLERLDRLNQRRIENAKFLIENLKDVKNLYLPNIPHNAKHIFESFVIQSNNRERLAKRLLQKGIDTSKGYIKACSNLKIFEGFKNSCPNAQEVERKILHLPIYPSLSEKDLLFIAHNLQLIAKTTI